MFKNLVHDPMNVTDFELNFLDQRRKLEKKLILDKDLEADDDEDEENKDDSTKKIWYMISGEWLYQWKCFISNKISNSSSVSNEQKSRVLLSENRDIGVLPPGPIKNDGFFTRDPNNSEKGNDPNSFIIKPDLELNVHYRGVNHQVWHLLFKIYGGGPVIAREELDIYSKDLSDQINLNEAKELSPFM